MNNKDQYSISELAKEFDITTRTIRFYEEKGMIHPRREGQKRIFSNADRVRIELILRGKRIGMSLKESVDIIDLYDPEHNNTQQLNILLNKVEDRRERLLRQKADIEDLLEGLDDVKARCLQAMSNEQ